MVQTFEGAHQGNNVKFAIVVARFNELITERLLQGALNALRRHGVREEHVIVAWVPGAFEIPVAAKRLAESGSVQAVICLGAVIRGATAHFDYICSQTAAGLARIQLDTGVPVSFGVLTTDTIEQAIERAGTKAGNKGEEAALAAIEMANLLYALDDYLTSSQG